MKNLILFSLILLFGCKEKDVVPNSLDGTWQLKNGKDKIEFRAETSLFSLVLREKNESPVIGEGLYFYTVFDNELEVLNSVSSCTCAKKRVYFKLNTDNTFEIEDFYKSNSPNNKLIFRKL